MHKELIGQTEFTFKLAETPAEIESSYNLRYEVLCRELQIIKPSDCPDHKEKDEFDERSLHFLCFDSHGLAASLRLILHDKSVYPSFPLERLAQNHMDINFDDLDHSKLAEVSRLTIRRDYRRRAGDGEYYTPDSEYFGIQNPEPGAKKRIRPLAFGLYRELYHECRRRGITHLYAIMDETLYTLLQIHIFVFHPIGAEFNYFGPARPYFSNLQETELKLQQRAPKLLEYFIEGLPAEDRPAL